LASRVSAATGSGKAQEGHFLLNSSFDATHKALADHRAHGAAHEFKFKTRNHQANAVYRAAHDDECIGFTGVFQCFFEALGVFAAVFELQRIDWQHFLADFIAAFVVQKDIQAGPRANAVVVAAAGADVLVLLQIRLVQHGFAAGALDPQAFRHAAAVRRVRLLNFRG
jgi:hypothetical protein